MEYILVKINMGYEQIPIKDVFIYKGREYNLDKLHPYEWNQIEMDEQIYYIPEEKHFYEHQGYITIANKDADIVTSQVNCNIAIDNGTLKVYGDVYNIYINTKKIFSDNDIYEIELAHGDQLLIENMLIIYHAEHLEISASLNEVDITLQECNAVNAPFEGFPYYIRSPRLVLKVPDEKVTINKPPAPYKMSKGGLLQVILSPLLMLCVTIIVAIIMKRGIFVIMSVSTTVMTMIFSITKYINDKKDCKEKTIIRDRLYNEYLLKKRKELSALHKNEQDAYKYNYPDVEDIERMIKEYNSRIYEKNTEDDDFLVVSVGKMRDKVSFEIEYNYDELKVEKDDLEDKAKIVTDKFSYIDNKAITVNLKKAHLGLIGEKALVQEQIKLLVAQLTFQHSYHDLQIIMIYDKKYNEEFRWMRWYPHLKIHSLNMSGIINSEQMRDQVLGSLFQILKERKLKIDENNKQSKFTPHFLFIIDEPKLIIDHSIMEYLNKSGEELGFSIIYTSYLRGNLPETIGTILEVNDSKEAVLLLNQNEVENKKIRLNHIGKCDLEWMARNMSALIHDQGVTSKIPESITFFEMYGVKNPSELDAERRWLSNQSYKSLAVPLGVRAEGDLVNLNLHEKAHGPHGLVAGTTGSGKSEIIQSYILSLAVNFHPYEVGFLLIDYKGGGMSGLFKNLPHLLGTITNLDGSESKRAMASIKSELARRQRIFSQHNVNHINSYNKLYRNGIVTEPIPHLFLISDEFAELKKEQPEFMDELISTARIGRSLGMHLILATQKPSGVVNDQIWTNSKFKLALKVQNEEDSREIIKTVDAAHITQAGRAYLQVGNNEIYELFQSAWSGAEYVADGRKRTNDKRVYIVNDLGQGELINGDLSVIEDESLKETQLDATIEYLKGLFDSMAIDTVKKPWLPSLPNLIVSPIGMKVMESDFRKIEEYDKSQLPDLSIPYGIIDIPEEQEQKEYVVDLIQDGNISYIASAGYGKTMFIMTSLLTLAAKNQVENLNFYILDLGNSALIPLSALPHTAEYMVFDNTEKINKFIKLINTEINNRKKLFAKKMVQNFSVYNQVNEEPLKAIIVVVDNFDVIKEFDTDVEDFFVKLSRDGAGLGIYFISTATRFNAYKYSIISNIKIKIAGFLFDETEARTIVGRSEYNLSEDKGRALVKTKNVNMMQIYSMVLFNDDIEYIQNIKEFVEIIRCKYPDRQAPHIPILPDNFVYGKMHEYPCGTKAHDLTVGLEIETVTRYGLTNNQTPFVIIGESGKGKTNVIKVLLNQMVKQGTVYLFDSPQKSLVSYSANSSVKYIKNSEDVEDFVEDIKSICRERRNKLEIATKSDNMLIPSEFYKNEYPIYIVLDEVDDFIESTKAYEDEICEVMKIASESGIGIIATANSAKLKGYDQFTRWIKTTAHGVVLSQQGILDIFPVRSIRDYPTVIGRGLLFHNGDYINIIIPECISESN